MAGARIVLLHGWGANIEKLEPLAEELRRLEWDVVTLKLPGFNMAPPRRVWGMSEYADYVLGEAKDRFGSNKFFVFGHSFGGRIAVKIASNSVDKLSGIILCSASGFSRGNPIKRTFFWILAKGGKIFQISPPFANFWRLILYKLAREHDYEKARGIMREIFKKVVAEDLRPLLKKISVPTLILWGREDRMTPVSDAYYANKMIKNSKLVILEDQGHQLPYKKVKKVAEKITKWSESQV